jgi:hypothetical protein
MTTPAPRVSFLLRLITLLAPIAASSGSAQNLFVSLGVKNDQPAAISIPAPDHGWDYSAAAPLKSTTWNLVVRPPLINVTHASIPVDNQPGPGRLGAFPLGDPAGISLLDASGQATAARLAISLNVGTLATDKPRNEPSFQSKGYALPVGLMDKAWRVYLGGNSLLFTVTGLAPGKVYDLYLYGSANNPPSADNPSGEGQGARFTLAAANIPAGAPASAETMGAASANLYTFSSDRGGLSLTPAGTTWVKLKAVVDLNGSLCFSTSHNARRNQYINGFQLVAVRP